MEAIDFETAVDQTITASNQLHNVVNGAATETVTTDSGEIPSVRKALTDSMLFIPPIPWADGENETNLFQTRSFDSGVYWAPSATTVNPVPMGSTPIGDNNWFLAPVSLTEDFVKGVIEGATGYRGDYEVGTLLEDGSAYIIYNGESYFATNPPYTTTATTPDNDTGNLLAGGYITQTSNQDFGTVSTGVVVKHRRGTAAEIAADTPSTGELWFNTTDDSIHMGNGVTLGGIKHINENTVSNYTDLVYNSVSDLTASNMSKVKPSNIDAGDIQVSILGYNGTWVDSEKHVTRTEYILTTIQRVRDSLNDQAWTPDGQRDFYLYGGTTYVAKISGSQYSLNTLGVKSGEDITVKLNAALSNPDIATNGLEIPAGTFYLSGNINCDFSNPVIKGRGQSLTKLIFTSNAGFVFGGTTPIKSIDIADMSIHTRGQANSGAAIYANHEIGSRPTSTFRRLFIAGVDSNDDLNSGNWFFRGIHTVNAMQPEVDNCRFIGAFATNFAEANRAEAAIKIEATNGAVIPRITNCWSLNFARGVMVRSSSTPSIEGVYISQCDWVYVNWGVDIEFTSSPYLPPQVNISNMHTEAFYQNIRIKGAKEILVTGCLLYSYNSAEPLQQIIIEDSENIRVNGNILVGRPNNTVTEGIRCNNCDISDVYDNTISTVNTHIAATGSTKFMKERSNTFLGSGAETADITGNTTNKMGRVINLGADSSYAYYNSEGLLIQGGSQSISFNNNFGAIVFPKNFNQIMKVSVTNGDGNASLLQPLVWSRTNGTANIAVDGLGSQPYRVDWEATGV